MIRTLLSSRRSNSSQAWTSNCSPVQQWWSSCHRTDKLEPSKRTIIAHTPRQRRLPPPWCELVEEREDDCHARAAGVNGCPRVGRSHANANDRNADGAADGGFALLTNSSEDHHPQVMSLTLAPPGSTTGCGVWRLAAAPVPSWPHLPQPQAKACPQAVWNTVCRAPHATCMHSTTGVTRNPSIRTDGKGASFPSTCHAARLLLVLAMAIEACMCALGR